MDHNRRIESSPEIEALLHSLLKMVSADTVILYHYIDEADVDETELLDLLSKSPMVNDIGFYESVITKKYNKKLQSLISSYERGTLDLGDEETKENILALKKYIKILRFCDLSEKDSKNSRWNFDYTRRPPKYIVLSNEILTNNCKKEPIPEEGVTAYFCRSEGNIQHFTKNKDDGKSHSDPPIQCSSFPPSWIFSRENINACSGHSHFGKDSTVFSNYDSHHAAWMLLQDSDKTLGCIRFEYYPEITGSESSIKPSELKKKLKSKFKEISTKSLMNLVVIEIKTVLAKQKEQSYSEQFFCLEPILKELKEIGIGLKRKIHVYKESRNNPLSKKEIEKLYEIHFLIEHLFYVLKRNTYYGESIIKRINAFIENLLKCLGLPQNIFTNIWENLKKHEDLMLYSLEDYRDHLMHQFHVFIIGYIVVYNYGIEDIKKLLEKNYCNYIKGCKKEENGLFSAIDIIRIWALISFFHDCGYLFEKISDGFENFSNRTMNSSLKAKFYWDELLFSSENIGKNKKSVNISGNLQALSKYFNTCENYPFEKDNLFRIFIQNAILKNDHGVISAIILLQQYNRSSYPYYDVPYIDPIMNIAALSIALHNKSVFKEAGVQVSHKICFKRNPFLFILIYCDSAQEWGRKKNAPDGQLISSPSLEKINFRDKKSFTLNLFYSPGRIGILPKSNEIKEKLSDATTTFVAPSGFCFQIFYNIRSSDTFPINFTDCGGKCPNVDHEKD
jgi:hypothetical protein